MCTPEFLAAPEAGSIQRSEADSSTSLIKGVSFGESDHWFAVIVGCRHPACHVVHWAFPQSRLEIEGW